MALFLSTYTMKVDKKGRVSVPRVFRAAVKQSAHKGVVVYWPFDSACIEGSDVEFFDKLSTRIYSDVSPFDDQELSVATAVLAEARQLTFDPEGRIMLPDDLRAQANISNRATFAGIGQKFRIWEPEAYLAHVESQREAAALRAKKMTPLLSGGG